MKDKIEFLKRDRKVSDAFIGKLEGVGLEVEYGKYSYWSQQPYLQVGREKVWLVTTKYEDNSSYLIYRYQNSVIADIYEVIKEQTQQAIESDNLVKAFFNKF